MRIKQRDCGTETESATPAEDDFRRSRTELRTRAGLSLVAGGSRAAGYAVELPRTRRSPLAMWHLLSFDAPTVAALWLWFVALCSGVALPWTSAVAMFVSVWMLYAADRLLDARPLGHAPAAPVSAGPLLAAGHESGAELEERHRFHYRHRRGFLLGIGGASLALVFLLPRLDPSALRIYAVLSALLFAYFFLIHIAPVTRKSQRLPKELAVGLFFPAAIFIPTVARASWLRLALLPAALCLAAVCTLNCLYLYAWEHPGSRPQAHWTTRFAARHLKALSCMVASGAAVAAAAAHRSAASSAHPAALFLIPLAAGVSALLLLWLHVRRARFSPIHLRSAADCALLTPLLFAPLLLVWLLQPLAR